MTGDHVTAPLPDRVTMGLLPYLNAHAVDEDYAEAAARRPEGEQSGARFGARGALVLVLFAVLAITAAVQTSKNSVSEERERRDLISQVKERRADVGTQRERIDRLQTENRTLQDNLLRSTGDSTGVLGQVALLGLRGGIMPAKGPGVEVVADDAPNALSDRNKVLDSDLQKLVNGLWRAGAEAISINGERLTALSAIRHAGSAITVNYTSLSRPYRVLAVGNPKTLPGRFAESTSGQAWLDLQREIGLRFTMTTESSLRLPGTDLPDLRYVKVSTEGSKGKGRP
ncbi:MAG: hypothetical protein JWQ74_298 [Marmoricola sp.]|nr:hypothetical protein [Marmoricola sp.]